MAPTQRLYFQYRPEPSTLEQLTRIQNLALQLNPHGRQRPLDKLHLTLLHIGVLKEVYEEIRVVNEGLSWEQYEEALKPLIDNTQNVLPRQLTVAAKKISLFGQTSRVLALELQLSSELRNAHSLALEQLNIFLHSCGIEHTTAFRQGSRNLNYSQKMIPHITLVRAAKQTFELDEPLKPLELSLLPLVYK